MKVKGKRKKNLIILEVIVSVVSIGLIIGVILFSRVLIRKREENKSQYYADTVNGYIESIKEYKVEELNRLGSLFSLETEYFEGDSPSELLLKAILSTISVNFKYIENGNVDKDSGVIISYIDYESLSKYIINNKEDIIKKAKSVKEGTARDKYILKDFAVSYLADIILSHKNRKTFEIDLKLYKDKEVDKIESVADERLNRLLFSDDSLYLIYDLLGEYLGYTELVPKTLLGVYYKKSVNTPFSYGNGSQESPAQINLDIESIYLEGEETNEIFIAIDTVYTGKEAVKMLNSLHEDNRGITTATTLDILVIEYTIVNLTGKELKVSNKLGLSDSLGNINSTKSNVFGLHEEGVLKPFGEIQLQWCVFNENLSSKYLIWGTDFKRQYPYIWFDCLQKLN